MDTSTPPPGAHRGAAAQFRYRFAGTEFDEARGVLTVGGEVVAVEPRPLQLLAELLRRVDEVITKEELFETVWERRPTVDNVLANAVNKLRKALGDEAGARIVNVPRVGYRLLGPVERMATGRLEPLALDLRAGQPVPHREGFRLERNLAKGGRRHVWLSRHARLPESRVFKFAVDAEGLRALKREFTLLRVLRAELGERPGFVRVLDANFAEAPYALEFEFGGVDLPSWAGAETGLQGLDQSARLAIFIQIAQAVAAAHSVGVLHKDLKPSNVLIAGEPGKWVIRLADFGSGQALDSERLSQLGLTALGLTLSHIGRPDSETGTYLYLAPEVLAGQAFTVQSDVYALGLILFQLLVADFERPLAPGWEKDVDDELLREDIAAATQGQADLRLRGAADLVDRLATLEARRAAAAQQRAQAASLALAAQRLDQARVRRPWRIAAMLFLVAGLVGSLGFAWRADIARREAEAAARRAQSLSDFAINDVLQSADIGRLGSNRVLLIDSVMSRVSGAAAERFRDSPETEGKVRLQLAELYVKLVKQDLASKEFVAAQSAFTHAGGLGDLRLEAMYGNVRALAASSKRDEVEAAFKAAVLATEALGVPDSNLPIKLARKRAEATLALSRQDFHAAADLFGEALTVADALNAAPTLRLGLLRGRLDAYLRLGDFAAAKEVSKVLLGPGYSAEVIGEINHARASVEVGRLMNVMNEFAEAEAVLSPARVLLQKKLGDNEMTLGNVTEELCNTYQGLERDVDYNKCVLEAQAIYMRTVGKDHQYTRIAGLNVAVSFFEVDNPKEALNQFEANRQWFVDHMGGESSPIVQEIDFHRARALLDLGLPEKAGPLLSRLSPAELNKAGNARYWAEMLDAERARVQVQTGGGPEARKRLERDIAAMRENGALDKETKRFVVALKSR